MAGAPFVGSENEDLVTLQAPVCGSTVTHCSVLEFHSFCWYRYSPPRSSVVPHGVQSVTGAAQAGEAPVSIEAAASTMAAKAPARDGNRGPVRRAAVLVTRWSLMARSPRRAWCPHTP